MSEVNGISGRARRFSEEEEAALRNDESTSSIVKRDAKSGVEIYGSDRSLGKVKRDQQDHVGLAGGLEVAHAAAEGAEITGALHILPHTAEAAAAFGLQIGGPLAALALGTYALGEAHFKGQEQARAIAKDNAHVALVGTLDLPAEYKKARFEGDYKHVSRDSRSPAAKMMEGLRANPKDVAVLQLHADRGMTAARDLGRSGMTVDAFFEANPKIAASYQKDAAFKEGFDAYLFAKAKLPKSEVDKMESGLAARDGWYAQSQIQVRG